MNFIIIYLYFLASPQWVINARINTSKKIVEGKLEGIMEKKLRVKHFLLHPNKFLVKPELENDAVKFRYFPRYFDSGYLKVIKVQCSGINLKWKYLRVLKIKNGGLEVYTGVCPEKSQISITFKVKIPKRYGPLSCMDGRCVMGAPWYPVPLFSAKELTVPVKPWRHRLRIESDSPNNVLGGKIFSKYIMLDFKGEFVPYAGGKGYHLSKVDSFDVFHYSNSGFFQKYLLGIRIDRLKEFLKKKNSSKKYHRTLMIETTIRENLAMALPGNTVLFAHQVFSVAPMEFFKSFHGQTLYKVISESVIHSKLSKFEKSEDLSYLPAVIALHNMKKEQHVNSVLKHFEWIPQIDTIMKSPRMDFRGSYFTGPGAIDSRRDDFRRWNNRYPLGEYVYTKLQDIFGQQELGRILEKYVVSTTPFRIFLEKYLGKDFSWFFEIWVDNPVPYVNYFIKSVKIRKTLKKEKIAVITVAKSTSRIREPVTVEVKLKSGKIISLVWDGKGMNHKFSVPFKGEISAIVMDPEERLTEKSTSDRYLPRYDNIWPSPDWRFIFSGFQALFNVTELLSRVYMDADILPRYDLGKRVNFLLFRNEIIEGGLGVSFLKYFGRNVMNTRLAWRYDIGFTSGITRKLETSNWERGYYSSVFTSLAWNTREDFVFPSKKGMGLLMASYNMYNWENDLQISSSRVDLTLTMSHYFDIGFGMVLAAFMHGGIQLGEISNEVEMLRLTGPNLLQGYVTDEFPGRAVGIVAAELRHVLLSRPDLTLGGIINLSRMTGAFYAGIGGVSGTMEGSFSENPRWASSVGYGVRLQGVWLGIYEGVLNFQVAVPLKKYESTKEPFVFFISFEPVF
ncbi:MAG: hypothetical protein JXR95_09220 [Deltaproteobacteria bacterium]|nr:hypothetical protein [Deltaproteobacteria bacterium]